MKKLYIISSGAGGTNYLTSEALKAFDECEAVVSYTKYIKDLKPLLEGKEIYKSGMTKEIERVQHAIDEAEKGRTVALLSNGDANVYAMGSLVVELLDTYDMWDKIEYSALPGISSVLALASEVGAPLSQDFCLISLSDRLTSAELIQKRIRFALEADFVISIYNPKSKSRHEPYQGMLNQLAGVEKSRVVIIARDLGRPEQMIKITTAEELIEAGTANTDVNMSTTLLIGNSTTKLTKDGRVLTPRGYLNKYELDGKQKGEWTKVN